MPGSSLNTKTQSPATAGSPRRWWILFAVAALSFLPVLGFYYVGEEAIFPISALEMWVHGEPVKRLLFGTDLQHNPLYAWLIMPWAAWLGWDLVLPIARLVIIAATVLTGLVVAWLAHALYRSPPFSALAAVVYVTLADLLLYRGWLAYSDPLFGLLVFSAIACLWVACERQHHGLLAVGTAALTAAFMTKALTAYVFYAGAGAVLLLHPSHRRFLLAVPALAIHAFAAALPLLWLAFFASSKGQGTRMFAEIVAKLAPESPGAYLLKLATYPLETLVSLAPAALLALWVLLRNRGKNLTAGDPHLRTVALIALLNYLPYWLAPHSNMRYLVPLYPLAGLVIARVLWLGGAQVLTVTRRWLVAAIVLKLVVVLVAFPLYQSRYRGENYLRTAAAIMARTAGHPLYTQNVSASGLSVAAYIDVARLPQPPLTFPPAQWTDGFVISYEPDSKIGNIAVQYRLGGNDLYLLCRGIACAAARAP
jgi:hypothetical protein